MNNNIETLNAVINTLDRIKTDNVDGNWNKIRMCQQAINQVIENIRQQEVQQAQPVEAAPEE